MQVKGVTKKDGLEARCLAVKVGWVLVFERFLVVDVDLKMGSDELSLTEGLRQEKGGFSQ